MSNLNRNHNNYHSYIENFPKPLRLHTPILNRLLETIVYESDNETDIKMRINLFEAIYNAHPYKLGLVIAKVMTALWSQDLLAWAERVVHKYALQNLYLKGHELLLMTPSTEVLDYKCKLDGHFISQEDIWQLVWEDFRMNQYFIRVVGERRRLEDNYELIKDFLPLPPDMMNSNNNHNNNNRADFYAQMELLINKHKLNHLNFDIAIGYTLGYAHSIEESPIWSLAYEKVSTSDLHNKEFWEGGDIPHLYLYQHIISVVQWDMFSQKHKRGKEGYVISRKEIFNYNSRERTILDHVLKTVNENSNEIKIRVS